MKLIVIAGMPATGKTYLSKQIQSIFPFPIIEKDAIKEQLFDTIGFQNYAGKRQLDVAANAVLFEILESLRQTNTDAIVVNNFANSDMNKLDRFLKQHDISCVTVFLNGDPQVLYDRYYKRDKNGERHMGHAMQLRYPPDPSCPETFDMTREGFDERFLKLGMDRIGWQGNVIYLDATYPWEIKINEVVRQIAECLEMPIDPDPKQNEEKRMTT